MYFFMLKSKNNGPFQEQCAQLFAISKWTTLREPIKFTDDADYLLKIVTKFKMHNKRSLSVCITAEGLTVVSIK